MDKEVTRKERCDSSIDTQPTDGRARTRTWRPVLFPASPGHPGTGTDLSLLLFRENQPKNIRSWPKVKAFYSRNDRAIRASSAGGHTSGQLGWGQVTRERKAEEQGLTGNGQGTAKKLASVLLKYKANSGGTDRHRPSYGPGLLGRSHGSIDL